MYDSLAEAVTQAQTDGISLGELALRAEVAEGLRSRARSSRLFSGHWT